MPLGHEVADGDDDIAPTVAFEPGGKRVADHGLGPCGADRPHVGCRPENRLSENVTMSSDSAEVTDPDPSPESRPLLHHVLVCAQLIGVAAAIVPRADGEQSGVVWLAIATAGIAMGIVTLCYNRIGNFSIYPTPRAGAQLITSGPYRLVRHPMYVSLSLMMIGIAGYNQGMRNALAAVLVIVVVMTKAAIEERLMRGRFAEYDDYCARSWRFIPYLF